MGTVSEGPKEKRFHFIAENRSLFGVRYLCSRLGVSTSGFYKWLKKPRSTRSVSNERMTALIRKVFTAHDGNYGSPRVHQALKDMGIAVNSKRVERIMREERLIAKAAKLYRRKALSGNSCIKATNLRCSQPAPSSPNQQWAGDVSYLKVNGAWVYLAVILDLYSRKVVGWSLGHSRTSELTMSALKMALSQRKVSSGLIFHSDKGAEYGAHEYQNLLKASGIRQSMNRPRMMTDNIHVESFFRTFKTETFRGVVFENIKHLREITRWYLEEYYNRHRIHTSIGFKSPEEYEKQAA